MRLGMSGSRQGMSEHALAKFNIFLKNNYLSIEEVHHGDCVGADSQFHNLIMKLGIKIIIHPPNYNKLRAYCIGDECRKELPFLKRNKNIVDESDMLVAFPPTKNEILRSGTWSTIRYAKKQNIKILIIYPDGDEKILN